ncbi:uncharacterized protein LOC131144999 [Malania oleifera]|uniref:uncharacterized protein LOC131144999 n=1 Tax=Malania oleifera TaxID=397392 RepID=UPI0025ADA373|nr:uncharacterized protein LOC131144999 [Malania oleifera]
MPLSRQPSFSPSLDCSTSGDFPDIAAKITNDFAQKLTVADDSDLNEVREAIQDDQESLREIEECESHIDDDDYDEDCEFSFFPNGEDFSLVSAEDIFCDGQIRPVYPIFNRDLLSADGAHDPEPSNSNASSLRPPLRKIFLEQRDPQATSSSTEPENDPAGPYCVWSGKAVDASPGACKKSNSTGFSKLWKFRDLKVRSSSDGKDAFVFLNKRSEKNVKIEKPEASMEKESSGNGDGSSGRTTAKGAKPETTSSAQKRRNPVPKARRSYLPYKQDILGFFTNVNGMSRNVHPF